jgi:POT family proton-dependent oligopeptide transporter
MQKQPESTVKTSHPIGVWFVFCGEMSERASFYGARSILALYFVDVLGIDEANALTYLSFFGAACYFLPLVGGAIAERFGRYNTIVAFSVPYVAGHFLLGTGSFGLTVVALSLLAMGSGIIKPNVSTLMGLIYDQQRPGQIDLREAGFYWFYFAINLGAAISQFAVPQMRTVHGYHAAFILPTALMVVALVLFALGKPFYADERLARSDRSSADWASRLAVIKRMAALFAPVMFFWAIFEQLSSTFVYFGKGYMDCTLFGKAVSPDALQACNPVFILILLPLVRVMWDVLEARGIEVPATRKMLLGFFLAAMGLAVMTVAAAIGSATGTKVTLWWQVGAYLLITLAEIFVSVTGLELAYSAAPPGMKSFVTAMWLAVVGIANLAINAPLTRLYSSMSPTLYFGLMAGGMMVVAAVFAVVARLVPDETASTAA